MSSARTRLLTRALVPFAALALLGGGAPAVAAAAPSQAHVRTTTTAAAPTFTVGGAVAHPLRLKTSDLRRRWDAHTVTVTYGTSTGTETHFFRGVLLTDVLTSAQPAFDPAVKNDALRYAVRADATDGYAAVVSWGEIVPGFGAKEVLLAYGQDHRALDRPRLVVLGDAKGGRYVSDVTAVTLSKVGA